MFADEQGEQVHILDKDDIDRYSRRIMATNC